MPRMRRKSDLPTKTCLACGLTFSWRKKWERDWDQVRYCSDRCRANKTTRPDEVKSGGAKGGAATPP